MRKTFYVAGPMRGVPKFNYPLFDEVAAALHRKGHNVINPADLDRRINSSVEEADGFLEGDATKWSAALGMGFHKVIGQDFVLIVNSADGLVMLPGWEKSEGAHHEKYVAEATGKEILYAHKAPTGQWLFVERVPAAMPQPLKIVGEQTWKVVSNTTVVGLMGYAQVGKDTLAAGLVKQHGFERIAFADALREVLYALNPIVPDTGGRTMRRLAALVDRAGWDHVKVCYPEVRELLQRLGTEAGREILGNDIWVETALRKIKPGGKYVITDVRFPNELAAVSRLGGKLIRIKREGYGPVNDHWSEKALDGFDADVEFWNCGTPQYLVDLVVRWLRNSAVRELTT